MTDGKPLCITGCGREQKARGYCSTHYERWRKTGDPGPVEIKSSAERAAERHAEMAPRLIALARRVGSRRAAIEIGVSRTTVQRILKECGIRLDADAGGWSQWSDHGRKGIEERTARRKHDALPRLVALRQSGETYASIAEQLHISRKIARDWWLEWERVQDGDKGEKQPTEATIRRFRDPVSDRVSKPI